MTDAELWQRWKARRDRDAFQRLVEANTAFVHDFARRVCGHDADAEDVAQEAFLELAEAPLDRPLQVGLRAFLGRRVVLAAKTLRRAALSRRAKEAQAPAPAPPRPGLRPETEEALALLDDEERHAVVLRFLHGLSYSEAAEVLGVSEGAARVRVHRALRRLRERLGPGAERAIAALPLFVPAATFPRAATSAASLQGGAVLMSASANRYLLVALIFLLLAGGLVAVRLAPRAETARSGNRAGPTAAASGDATALAADTEKKAGEAPQAAGSATAPLSGKRRPQTARVAGRLRFADGSPARDLLVGPNLVGTQGVRTDEEGRFSLDSPLFPPFDLCAIGPDGYMLSLVEIPAGASEVDATLERGATLKGVVLVEGTRQPVPGAILELRRPGAAAGATIQARMGKGQTDTEGRFAFEHALPATYDLTLTAKGFEPMVVSTDVDDRSPPLELFVRAARDMTVRFAGFPDLLRGRKVSLSIFETDRGPLRIIGWDVEIDDRNEVHVEAPPPGGYGLQILPARGEKQTGMPPLSAKFESTAGKPVLVVLESVPRARVEGTVLLPDGSPAALRQLRLEHSQLRTLTTIDGQFVFEDARAGEETLSLRDDMTDLRVARVEVPAHGVLRLDVRLTGTGSVTGRFASPAGRWDPPIVLLRRKADGERVAWINLPGDGRFRIPYLDRGAYVLIVGVIKKGSVARDVSVENGEVDVGDLALDPAPEVPVVCEIPAGARVAGEVPVRAKGAVAEGWLALGDDGRGFLRALPPGRYRISFTVRDCAPVEADIEVEAVPSQPLVFTLSPR